MKKKALTKKEVDKLDNFLYNHVWNIQQCLRLAQYKIKFGYKYVDKKEYEQYKDASMTIFSNSQYLEADIYVSKYIKELWQKKNHKTILEILIHEICHLLIDPVYDSSKKGTMTDFFREQSTEHISRWGVRLYKDWMEINKINIKTGK